MMKPITHGNNGTLCLKLTKESNQIMIIELLKPSAWLFDFYFSWAKSIILTEATKLPQKYKNHTSPNFMNLRTWLKKMICKVFFFNRGLLPKTSWTIYSQNPSTLLLKAKKSFCSKMTLFSRKDWWHNWREQKQKLPHAPAWKKQKRSWNHSALILPWWI